MTQVNITKTIVGYGIKKDAAQDAAPQDAAPRSTMHEEIERPEVLRGTTYKFKPGGHDNAMYVTINDIELGEGTEHKQKYPFEIFINSKRMEEYEWVMMNTRVCSAVFRKGGDCTFLVNECKQVFSPTGGYFYKGTYMPSVVAHIGYILERHFKSIGLIEDDEVAPEQARVLAEKRARFEASDESAEQSRKQCHACHTFSVVRLDGCDTCLTCGDSKCN